MGQTKTPPGFGLRQSSAALETAAPIEKRQRTAAVQDASRRPDVKSGVALRLPPQSKSAYRQSPIVNHKFFCLLSPAASVNLVDDE
jgi:hypothetical protein